MFWQNKRALTSQSIFSRFIENTNPQSELIECHAKSYPISIKAFKY
jgi:hypothetical protein